jgi:AraC-like DNA-binding protein
MFERRASLLVQSSLFEVHDVRCRTSPSGYGAADRSGVAQIIAPRRGVFGVERRGEPFVIDAASVFIVHPDDECRVSHPGPDGDDCTVIVPPLHVIDEWVARSNGGVGRLRPVHQLAVCHITRALKDPHAAPLEVEESTVLLLSILARAFPVPEPTSRVLGPAQRLRVEQVRALLASAPAERWCLATVARAVDRSPFHLARQFRAATGETMSRYLLRLRLSMAIDRLAEGERDLSTLAVETGFAHHSHFSTRFRAVFGMTPTAVRETLTRGRIEWLRRVAEADGFSTGGEG